MLVKLMSKVISKIKHTDYKVDKNITDFIMLGIVFEKFAMIIRGLKHKLFLKKSKGLLFVGKRVQLKCRKKIAFKGTALIEDGVKIDALSKGGIEIGENFSIGRNSIIESYHIDRAASIKNERAKDPGKVNTAR